MVKGLDTHMHTHSHTHLVHACTSMQNKAGPNTSFGTPLPIGSFIEACLFIVAPPAALKQWAPARPVCVALHPNRYCNAGLGSSDTLCLAAARFVIVAGVK